MPDEEQLLIKYQLEVITNTLADINKKLDKGHDRMDEHETKILKMEIERKNSSKQVGAIWAISLLAVGAFLNSYFQAIYTKPKDPVAPITKEVKK